MDEKTFKIVNGDISDGYHTFGELYEHRCLLFIAWMMSDGCPSKDTYFVRDHFEGWDLIVTHLNDAQISYHVPNKYRPHYEEFMTEKTDPQWDGHTSQDVVNRLNAYLEAV